MAEERAEQEAPASAAADAEAPERQEPPHASGEHPIARMLLIGAVASAIGVGLVLLIDWFPTSASNTAGPVDTLYDVTLGIAVPIFVLVMTVAIYSVARFRARPGDSRDGAPVHGDTRLEVLWVAIPFLIVSALATYSWIVLDDIEARQQDQVRVSVRAQQFAWSFEYPQPGGPPVQSEELVLPVGRQANFDIRAVDVIHSFWVPAFRIKQDAVPGIKTETRTTPTRAGRFDIVCAELCGAGHSTMRQNVRVVPAAEFDRWLASRRSAAGGPGGTAVGAPATGGGRG